MNDTSNRAKCRRLTQGLTVVVTIAICALIFHLLFPGFIFRGEARKEILHLFEDVSLNSKPEAVDTLFEGSQFKHLKLRKWSTELWVIQTPFEAGAVNWDLYIEFSGSNVTAVRVREADNRSKRPALAPTDKSLR